jgi:hypothetical protein
MAAPLEPVLQAWREPVAGVLALGIGVYDSWVFGSDAGLTGSLDEILIIGGIVLIAGSRRLFPGGAPPDMPPSNGRNE